MTVATEIEVIVFTFLIFSILALVGLLWILGEFILSRMELTHSLQNGAARRASSILIAFLVVMTVTDAILLLIALFALIPGRQFLADGLWLLLLVPPLKLGAAIWAWYNLRLIKGNASSHP